MTVQVLHTDGVNDNTNSPAHTIRDATVDGNGNFSAVWDIPLNEDELGATLEVTATADDGEIMGVRHRTHAVEGVQFHPEAILTEHGKRLLANFLERR